MNDVGYLLSELMQDRVTYEYAKDHFKPNDYVAILIAPPYKPNDPIIIHAKIDLITEITCKGIMCEHLGLLKYNYILDIIKFENKCYERRCFEDSTQ